MCKTQEKKFVSLVSDTTFKYLWKNENTRGWMNDIIKTKTGIDLSDFDIIDGEQNSGNDILKDYRSDVTLSDKKEIVIIEMNSCKSESVETKGRYYMYRRAGNGFEQGDKEYKNVKKVTLIMINDYLNDYDKNCKLSNSWFGDHKLGLKYDDIEMYQIYLPTYRELCYDDCNEIDKRLWLFKATSFEEMHDNVKDDPNLYIVEELERLSVNNFFIDEYDREAVNKKLMRSLKSEGYREGKNDGITEGKSLGEKQKQVEIAKKSFEENIDIQTISKITGLSIEELENLK